MAARCREETFTAALVPNVEAGSHPCSTQNPRDARDAEAHAEGSPVGCKYERVWSRMTRQTLVGAVTGDQSTDSPFDTDSDVCVTSRPFSLVLEAGAVALASRAQTMSRNVPDGVPAHTRAPSADFSIEDAVATGSGVLGRFVALHEPCGGHKGPHNRQRINSTTQRNMDRTQSSFFFCCETCGARQT